MKVGRSTLQHFDTLDHLCGDRDIQRIMPRVKIT